MRSITPDELTTAVSNRGLLTFETVERLKKESRRRRIDILDLITAHGRFPCSAIYCAAAEVRGLPFVDYNRTAPDIGLAKAFPQSLIKRGTAIPVSQTGNRITIACSCPDDHLLLAEIERRTGLQPQPALAEPQALKDAASHLIAQLTPGAQALTETDPVDALDRIMKEAYLRRASDIHLDPQPDRMHVRIRIDGRLEEIRIHLPHPQSQAVVSRIKVLSGLDIAETRSAQDGGYTYDIPSLPDTRIDLRIATIATKLGERVTIRILAQESKEFGLSETGMSPTALELFRKGLKRPHGMILITGPTGSGKSTTLYASLREIRRPEVNIMTLEDPIESNIPGISQVQVGGSDKITFAKGLRSMLRHDPDIIMVGEIRDQETADVALRASMTGHLIFSTLHTNDAASAVTRLMDIGCEPYLIASTLVAVVAQRLVRRLCEHCKEPRSLTENERKELSITTNDTQVFGPSKSGCSRCVGTGFQGRIGVFEMLWLDSELQRIIADQCSQKEWKAAIATRTTELREDGYRKVLEGKTTLEEVLGVAVQ